ncbi:hypothetical protein CI109_103437 [Kwoniella shandongensis]|uniref:Late embryogenesis abundant protein LEA-2 subgroup domain-containing protein n=1 Tax=Kwoniella shandongensis TaxID=1734106 RepID=A0A5M6BWM4_9TREE|nr:uncharacterized protein CI109_004517 [Kwoniella shandongensis]KAA5527224.1 hypothetical protein CI109_004517 [Kwoniella shandongensis]
MTSRLSTDFPHTQPPRQSGYGNPFGYADHQPHNSLYYEQGEEEDEPFDVRADFDGTGPRWSDRYGQGQGIGQDVGKGEGSLRSGLGGGMVGDDRSYRPVDDHVAPTGHTANTKSATSREELVSVPVLGAEWQKSELHELSRRGQSELRGEKRTRAWREWTRDQRGLCGSRWFTRRILVGAIFAFVVALGIALFFLIPRVPSFEFYGEQPFSVDNSTISFNRTPTNFSFSGNLNLYADASSSYLPVHFTSLQAKLYDLTTDKLIATGDWGNHRIAHKDQQPVLLPVTFSYSALNTSDTTWNDMYDACGHLWTGTTRPDLKFRLVLRMSIMGLVNHPEQSTQISDVTCPFELPGNSV